MLPDQEHDLARMDSDVAAKHGARRLLPRPIKLPADDREAEDIQVRVHAPYSRPAEFLCSVPPARMQAITPSSCPGDSQGCHTLYFRPWL